MAHNVQNGKNGRKSRRWAWAGVAVIILAGAGVAVRASLEPNRGVDPSKLVQIERGAIARSVVATGRIEPRTKVEVKSKASGIVKRLFVDYGEQVRRGQVLAELDREELQARLREAKAMLLAAEASREAAQASHERNRVEAEGPDLPFLKADVERARKLHTDGLIAAAVLETTEKALQMALNKQMTALRNVAVARAEIGRAAAQVAQARAALDRAEEDLRNATITSPMDGLVLSRDVEVGDAVSSILVLGSQATLLMTLGDTSDVYVLGKVDEADIGKVYLGQKARIVVESFKERKFEGQITKISPLGVEENNVTTFEVRVSIANPGGELKANMTANAEIILEEKPDVLLVREAAVVYDRDRKTFLEVPDPTSKSGRAKVAVELGISNGIQTELVAGLNEGDRVILQ